LTRKFLDSTKKQLICIEEDASRDYWDSHWNFNKEIAGSVINTKNTFVSKITKKYLKNNDGLILEGGSGIGANVASLVNNGYMCIGVDYAEKTVNKINQYIPELDIRIGDITRLKFEDSYFIGYWSIGVIEHYWEGYRSIMLEMRRVIKNDGYLFLSFPCMSLLRRLKIVLRLYKLFDGDKQPKSFYQFILNQKLVIKDFQNMGFKLIKSIPFDGIKGTKDEVLIIKSLLQKIYDYNNNNILFKLIKKIVDLILVPVGSHCVLLVFRKTLNHS